MDQALDERRPGDPAAEPPRLLDAHPVPGVRPRGPVSRVRDRPDAPPHRSRSRCATTATTRCPRRTECPECGFLGIRYSGHGHAAAGGGGQRPIPRRGVPADGHRHDAGARQPRAGAGRLSRGQGADSAGHADDRQGARFSERDAGGRDQRRHGAAPARLPRGRADVSSGHAGGGPHGPRARRAAACWCRRSAPSIRRFKRRSATTTPRSPRASCRCARCSAYPPFDEDDSPGDPRPARGSRRRSSPATWPGLLRRGRSRRHEARRPSPGAGPRAVREAAGQLPFPDPGARRGPREAPPGGPRRPRPS